MAVKQDFKNSEMERAFYRAFDRFWKKLENGDMDYEEQQNSEETKEPKNDEETEVR